MSFCVALTVKSEHYMHCFPLRWAGGNQWHWPLRFDFAALLSLPLTYVLETRATAHHSSLGFNSASNIGWPHLVHCMASLFTAATAHVNTSLLTLSHKFTLPRGVVKNYVPRTLYPQTYIPRTLETMHSVPLPRDQVPCTLETMHFDQKFDKKVEKPIGV